MVDVGGNGLRVDWDGPVLRLTLARHLMGNALVPDTISELGSAIDAAARSEELRAVALTAVGSNFCTGVDLQEANRRARPTARTHRRARAPGTFSAVLPKGLMICCAR